MAVEKPKIGDLRNIGHFENNDYIQPYTAGYVDGYSNVVASVYCKLRQVHTRKVDDFGQVQIISSWVMWCRFQSAISSNLLDNTKFVQGSRRFTITGWQVIDERSCFYFFNLNEITA